MLLRKFIVVFAFAILIIGEKNDDYQDDDEDNGDGDDNSVSEGSGIITPSPTPFQKNPIYLNMFPQPSIAPTPYPSFLPTDLPTLKTSAPSTDANPTRKPKKIRKRTDSPVVFLDTPAPTPWQIHPSVFATPAPTPWQIHPSVFATPAPTPYQLHPSKVIYPTNYPTPFVNHPAYVKPMQDVSTKKPIPNDNFYGDDFSYGYSSFDHNYNNDPSSYGYSPDASSPIDDDFSPYHDIPSATPVPLPTDLISNYPSPSTYNIYHPTVLPHTNKSPNPTLTTTSSSSAAVTSSDTSQDTATGTSDETPDFSDPAYASSDPTLEPTVTDTETASQSDSDSTNAPGNDYSNTIDNDNGDGGGEEIDRGQLSGQDDDDAYSGKPLNWTLYHGHYPTRDPASPPAADPTFGPHTKGPHHKHRVSEPPSVRRNVTLSVPTDDDPVPLVAAQGPEDTFMAVVGAWFVRMLAVLLLLAAAGVAWWMNRVEVVRALRRLAHLPLRPSNYNEVDAELELEDLPRFSPSSTSTSKRAAKVHHDDSEDITEIEL